MPVTISGSGPITGLTSITAPTTLNGLSIPTTGFGKILQVVSVNYSTIVSSSSGSYVTTGLNATITPSFSTSKILILVEASIRVNGYTMLASVFRGTVSGTKLAPSSNTSFAAQGTNSGGSISIIHLDSPSTTSAQIYTLGFGSSPSTTVTINGENTTATMTLMEISA